MVALVSLPPLDYPVEVRGQFLPSSKVPEVSFRGNGDEFALEVFFLAALMLHPRFCYDPFAIHAPSCESKTSAVIGRDALVKDSFFVAMIDIVSSLLYETIPRDLVLESGVLGVVIERQHSSDFHCID